ncbi:MAG: hypothetical protein J2P53_13875 [Bradyrhizobiaceae bacterium]|nr:hypothetical protein [Bradyrhizobiaceae bacterium]
MTSVFRRDENGSSVRPVAMPSHRAVSRPAHGTGVGECGIRRLREQRGGLPRRGKPRDLAGIAVLAASDAGAYITTQEIAVDGV